MIGLSCLFALFALSNAAALPKIVGGHNTTIEEVPWAVIINSYKVLDNLLCAGTIISKNYILTTSSCTRHNGAEDLVIRSGTALRLDGGTDTMVESIAANPNFDIERFDYDIAVLKLKTPLNISKTQKPVPLSLKTVQSGRNGLIAGWGTGVEGQGFALVLQSAQVPIVDPEVCQEEYGIYRNVTERMVCAGSEGVDGCMADAGIPLTIDDVLFGVLSWSNGCGLPGFPGVYANVAALKEFIDEHSNGEATWV